MDIVSIIRWVALGFVIGLYAGIREGNKQAERRLEERTDVHYLKKK